MGIGNILGALAGGFQAENAKRQDTQDADDQQRRQQTLMLYGELLHRDDVAPEQKQVILQNIQGIIAVPHGVQNAKKWGKYAQLSTIPAPPPPTTGAPPQPSQLGTPSTAAPAIGGPTLVSPPPPPTVASGNASDAIGGVPNIAGPSGAVRQTAAADAAGLQPTPAPPQAIATAPAVAAPTPAATIQPAPAPPQSIFMDSNQLAARARAARQAQMDAAGDTFSDDAKKQFVITGNQAFLTQDTKPAGKTAEGELPLGAKVEQFNDLLQQRWQVLNPTKPIPPAFVLKPNATQKDYDRVDKALGSTESALATKAQQDTINATRQQTLALAAQAHADHVATQATKPVLAYDSNNRPHLLSDGDARAAGYTGITEATPKQIDDAKTHTVVLNAMQTQLNSVVASRAALDQGEVQRAIISKALSHSEPGLWNDWINRGALDNATDLTKTFIQSALALKEAALALPKELTGGSRVSDIQASAMFKTLAGGSAPDSKYALDQSKKFQADIDRLRQRAPEVRGLDTTAPHADLSTGNPASPPAGFITIKASDNTLHFIPEGAASLAAAKKIDPKLQVVK